MFDSVDVSQLPDGDYAYAGYVNGHWANFSTIQKRFPGKPLLSIAVTAKADADCLDIERGDATNADSVGWVKRQHARGLQSPVVYTSVSNLDALVSTLAKAGIPRTSYRIWSAHYAHEHICAPDTCRLTQYNADGTQWGNGALGRNLDQSLLHDNFFNSGSQPQPSPAPPANSSEVNVAAIPTVQQGSNGQHVRILQGLLVANGRSVSIDGGFGPDTANKLRDFQRAVGIGADAICGPITWTHLLCI